MNRTDASMGVTAARGKRESLLSLKDQTKPSVTREQKAYDRMTLDSKPGPDHTGP